MWIRVVLFWGSRVCNVVSMHKRDDEREIVCVCVVFNACNEPE